VSALYTGGVAEHGVGTVRGSEGENWGLLVLGERPLLYGAPI
jgi:hypothetical protein